MIEKTHHIVNMTAANGRDMFEWEAAAVRVRHETSGVYLDIIELNGYDWSIPIPVGARVTIAEAIDETA